MNAKLLLALARTMCLGSKSRGTHDHILLSGGSGSYLNLRESIATCFQADFFLHLFFDIEDAGDMFL
jgi:hypothetical protein